MFDTTRKWFGDKIDLNNLGMKLVPINEVHIATVLNVERGIWMEGKEPSLLYSGSVGDYKISLDYYPDSNYFTIRDPFSVIFRGTINSTQEFDILLKQLGYE